MRLSYGVLNTFWSLLAALQIWWVTLIWNSCHFLACRRLSRPDSVQSTTGGYQLGLVGRVILSSKEYYFPFNCMLIYPLLEKIDAYVLSDGELCLSFGRLGGWLIASVCCLWMVYSFVQKRLANWFHSDGDKNLSGEKKGWNKMLQALNKFSPPSAANCIEICYAGSRSYTEPLFKATMFTNRVDICLAIDFHNCYRSRAI